MKNWTLDDGGDVIDSRDIIARLEELTDTLQAECDSDFKEANPDSETDSGDLAAWLDGERAKGCDSEHESEIEEYDKLTAICEEGEQEFPDWTHGEGLVRDSYFEEYAEELADDIGAIDKKAGWPLTHIDWKAAADALKQDYTSIEIDGETYWGRS